MNGTATRRAGLRDKKRLSFTQAVEWLDNYNNEHTAYPSANLDALYTYNTEGRMTSVTYPGYGDFDGNGLPSTAGGGYNYSVDTMGRLSGMTDQGNHAIVSNVTYGPGNELLTMNYNLSPGYSPTSQEIRSYSSLLQLTNINVKNEYGTVLMNLSYNYTAGVNNGKISSQGDAVSGETVTYAYDSLNRLITANSTAGWGETYGYDGFGNLTDKVGSGGAPTAHYSFDSHNWMTSPYQTYDANGNQGSGPPLSGLTYDVENRLVYTGYTGTHQAYGYDAQNKRVWQWDGQVDGLGNTKNYVVNFYGVDGKRLAQYQFTPGTTIFSQWLSGAPVSGDAWFGSRRVAMMDRLGSVGKYYPYGEDKPGPGVEGWNLGTYWRDAATGLDYADQRYYGSGLGRFLTADPSGRGTRINNPQSLNRYSYVLSDPVNHFDPTGLDACDPFDLFPDDECDPFDIPIGILPGPVFGGSLFVLTDVITASSLTQQEQKKRVLDWSKLLLAAEAAGAARSGRTATPFPLYLRVASDCYTPSAFTTGVTERRITYQLVGSDYEDMKDILATVSEHLFPISGRLPEAGTSSGGGAFDDRISIEGTRNFQLLQQFTAAVRDVFGVPGFADVPVYVINRLGIQYGTNNITATANWVDINGDKNLTIGGVPRLCP